MYTAFYFVFCFPTLTQHYFSFLHAVHLEWKAEHLERMKQAYSESWSSTDVQEEETEILKSM